MVFYNCPRCNYSTEHKTKYVNHLKKKNICEPILSKTNLQKEYIKFRIEDKIKVNPKESTSESKIGSLNPNESKRIHFCKYCEKIYSNSSNLSKHLKKCNDKIKTDEANFHMQELVKVLNEHKEKLNKYDLELEEKNKQINELIKKSGINNSTITQNIQNNIKLLAYDKTDISDLTDKDFMKCFNHNNMCVPHLVKRIHFNPKKPENHNVFISNLKSGYIMIYDGKKWNTYNRDEIVDDIFDDKHDILEQKIEEWVNIGKDYPIIYHKFKRYLEKINNDTVFKKVKDELKLILYNNRTIIKKNN